MLRGNAADDRAGGIFTYEESTTTLVNVTFDAHRVGVGNGASGLYIESGVATGRNCDFSANARPTVQSRYNNVAVDFHWRQATDFSCARNTGCVLLIDPE